LVTDTLTQFDHAVAKARKIFEQKTRDYGTSWRIMRTKSLTDQIFIKAQRIRTVDTKGKQMIEDNVQDEFIGILNYCVIALMQMELSDEDPLELLPELALTRYDKVVTQARELMIRKNHDYGEAWRDMRINSFTDLIMMRVLRIRQIEDNEGKTIASEGIDSNLLDIINYSIFALIKLDEQT
jgi:hypothetical protein